MKKSDKDFLKKLVFDKRFPLDLDKMTEVERFKVTSIIDNYSTKEIAEVMREAKEEMN